MHQFSSALGEVTLSRYPSRPDDPLRAFDGADRLLVDELATDHAQAGTIWVLGDRQGALSTAIAADGTRQVSTVTDSALARAAIDANLAANHARATVVTTVAELDAAAPDLVLVRPGKSKAMLQQQLHQLASRVPAGTPVVLGEMAKHLREWMTDVLTDHIGPTTASLGRYKARLLRSSRGDVTGAAPTWTSYTVNIDARQVRLHNSPGTFASSALDRGTALLLDHLPIDVGRAEVIDVGCGNGILAIAVALLNPDCRLTLIDESAAAISSARESWQRSFGARDATFVHADGLSTIAAASADLVVCNPPFHEGTVVDEWFGRRLLDQARDSLRPGGELWVVANRHLSHHHFLKSRFARVDVVAADAKFSVLRAITARTRQRG